MTSLLLPAHVHLHRNVVLDGHGEERWRMNLEIVELAGNPTGAHASKVEKELNFPSGKTRENRAPAGKLGLLFGSDDFHALPGTLRALRLRLVAILDAVVLIRLANRAERFVVQAGKAQSFFQFFGELLQSFQMIGGSGNFGLCGLEYLLVTAVDELGNLATD
jgi:hypothetical protein